MLRSFHTSVLLAARRGPDQLLFVWQCPFSCLYLGGTVLKFLCRALRDTGGGGDGAQDARDISITEGAAGGPDSHAANYARQCGSGSRRRRPAIGRTKSLGMTAAPNSSEMQRVHPS